MKKYLSVSENKEELIEFLLHDWSTHGCHLNSLRDRNVFFTSKNSAYEIYVSEKKIMCQPVDALCSNYKEVDTKVFLAEKVVEDLVCSETLIITVDSDIGILACYYSLELEIRLLVQIDVGNNV